MDVKLSSVYHWCNYSNREELVLQFYTKFVEHITAFPFIEDCAISLCKNSDDESVVHLFVDVYDIYNGKDNSVANDEKVKAFLKTSGCPDPQGLEVAASLPNLTIDNVQENLTRYRVRLIRGVARKGKRFICLGEETAAVLPQGATSSTPKGCAGMVLLLLGLPVALVLLLLLIK